MKIKTFYDIEPIVSTKEDDNGRVYGLHRDRCPDAGWDEFRWTIMDKAVETEITEGLKQTLIEDICEYYGGMNSYKKLKELDLIK